MHPALSTSTQLIWISTQLSATSSTLLEPKYRTKFSSFPKFKPKNPKLSILTENWHRWYFGGANSKSGLKCLKFRIQNPIFEPKILSCLICPKTGTHGICRMLILIRTLLFWLCNPKSFLGKFGQKSQSCPIYVKTST